MPNHIIAPNYISQEIAHCVPESPEIKNENQIAGMRESCKLAAKLLQKIGEFIQVTTEISTLNYI